MIDLITGLLTLAAALISYFVSKNLLITVLATVAAVMIIRSFKPYMQYAWQKRHPSKQIKLIKEEGNTNSLSLGMQVLLLTQNVTYRTELAEELEKIWELINSGIEQLKETNAVFSYKYQFIKKRKFPMRFSYGSCGNSQLSVRMHYYEWIRKAGINQAKNLIEGKDIFTLDLIVKDKNGVDQGALLQVMFDPRLTDEEQ